MPEACGERMTAAQNGVAAVVLAAGRSSRMGQPKQLLRVGGRTVLECVLENVRCAGIEEIVLVLGCEAERIQREISSSAPDGAKVVLNPNYEQGMASSLRAGLEAVSEDASAALIVLGDQPFVRSETVRSIAEAAQNPESEIVIPAFCGKRGNPVRIGRTLFAEAMALEGDTGCRALFAAHANAMKQIAVEDEGILLDLDNPDDYRKAGGVRTYT